MSVLTSAAPRRRELAEFLRARRARLEPADVGLAPGVRRRTPGLRREEVALLAGVGVTWYTWLEQGRPIRASDQVLDAVAGALRLEDAERAHLHRLAGSTTPPHAGPAPGLPAVPDGLRDVLSNLDPLPAVLLNSRFDILLVNSAYDDLFRDWHTRPCSTFNQAWCTFADPGVHSRILNFTEEAPVMVGNLRAAYAEHLGDPEWTSLIRELAGASPMFAELWSRHDVTRPGSRTKVFLHPRAGELTMVSTTMDVADLPETRLIVYSPVDAESRSRLALTRVHEPPRRV